MSSNHLSTLLHEIIINFRVLFKIPSYERAYACVLAKLEIIQIYDHFQLIICNQRSIAEPFT